MNFYEYFSKIDKISNILKKNDIILGNSSDGFNITLIISDFYSNNKSIFVVLPSLYLASKYYDTISLSLKDSNDCLFFPSDELFSLDILSDRGDFLFERINTLYNLTLNEKKIIITNLSGALKYEIGKNEWIKSCQKINVNDVININDLINNLIHMGYEKTYTVSKTGEFAKRGSILDIFPLGSSYPIRIDFFDDYIESIKSFDIDSQRSKDKLDSFNLLPVTEILYSNNNIEKIKKNILSHLANFELSKLEEEMYNKDLNDITLHKLSNRSNKYISFFNDNLNTIFDFKDNKKIYLIDPKKCESSYSKLLLDLNDSCKNIHGYSLESFKLFKDYKYLYYISNVKIEGLTSIENIDININSKDINNYKASRKLIGDEISELKNNNIILLSLESNERKDKLEELFYEYGVSLVPIYDFNKLEKNQINYTKEYIPSFDLYLDNFKIINQSTIFDYVSNKKPKYKSVYKNAQKISKYDELEIGDYIVHYDYGIGKYMGIVTSSLDGIKRDMLYIAYANNDSLYVPLEKINQIMKYASKDSINVNINGIGDGKWARLKAKARSRINDISDKLISLYAKRMDSKGFAFPPDSEYQLDFENDFPYELTPDQAKAISDVKHDMENIKPMDRLICGDVGYGKTEIALRAAFKGVYGGKQVAVLAPTTILASQHFHTFKSRMEKYGINVAMLSRLIKPSIQDEIIKDIKSGKIDIVIGTHRLLSKEIEYKDLGLLIVDEEQRFGVTHKERIKELKINIDCITLSATPIPRTLQMSMMGIKDLSMIETPPLNRYPIQTYVLERSDKIIVDVIERELSRNGQVFYLYNRVEDIEDVASKLKNLVPFANIAIAHGKLSKEKLENTILDFINKKYNVLVCTTIIETGIDIPETNTLIVHDADNLGLSQLYQLRGRVGRSSNIAYAYLMYEPRKKLTSEAELRLKTIKEFNELGSGFKIAMRDLSIRGSGDILGSEQSGFIETIGLDMYLKILDEEIKKKNNENIKIEESKPYDQIVDRTISKDYIQSDDSRISIHQKIDKMKNVDDYNDLYNELIDRFGNPPIDLILYMKEKLLRIYAELSLVDKISNLNGRRIVLKMDKASAKLQDGLFLFKSSYKFKDNLKLEYKNEMLNFYYDVKNNKEKALDDLICYFKAIYEHNLENNT